MTVASLLPVFLVVCGCLSEYTPSVTTNSGKIRGRYLISYKGNKYEAYKGIPYAEPPVGDKRFQPPIPVQPWTHELKATNVSQPCFQNKYGKIIGSEDCLYVNVHVPTSRESNESLPVIFFIHGGSFQTGHVDEDAEHYIMDYSGVIYVSTHYRLGVLGFLSTDDDIVPGNMGLKDQSTALRWVHDNIQHFGGDPKRITLVGQSAGSISVHYHYMSPWSRGLFNAGVSLSGTAFDRHFTTERPRDFTMQLGRTINCTDEDARKVVKCLRTQPVDKLFPTMFDMEVDEEIRNQSSVIFYPVVEKSSLNPFIDDSPHRIIERGNAYDVPWITGVTSEEALHFALFGFIFPHPKVTIDVNLKNINDNWLKIAPIWLQFYHIVSKDQHRNVSRTIRDHYMKGKPINRENTQQFIDMLSDKYVSTNSVNAATRQAAANKSPVFFYRYRYRATDNLSKFYSKGKLNLGVAHADDLLLILKNRLIGPLKSSKDMDMLRTLMRIWTSVARNGVPNMDLEWRRVSPNNDTFDYLQIDGPDELEMKSSVDLFEKKFWDSINLGI